MIESIIEWSAKNRIFVFVISAIAVVGAWWVLTKTPLDAIPDLSDTQVILYARWDRPPQILEDQVAYPVISALLGAPKVKDIRAFSDYGYSYIYLIFEDGTDVYWARSRVLEYLSKVQSSLPAGVKIELGPDATGVGWVYEYALTDESGTMTQADLKAFQDWHLKYALQSVSGVSEVATLGGMTKQYQVVVNPQVLLAYGITMSQVTEALRTSNQETGARLLEFSGREYMVTVKGYLKGKSDIEQIVLKTVEGVPIRVKDVASVTVGPDLRRGVAEYNGRGETTGGIVVMRTGQNAMDVIARVKEKLAGVTLPPGVKVVPVYDRSELIQRSVDTLEHKLAEEILVVALVIIIFLLHVPSAAIPILTLPVATLLSFVPLYFLGMSSNIMSLGGIAIAIGAMVDGSIVVVENTHKRISQWQAAGQPRPFGDVLLGSMKEVGRSSFFSLLVIAVAFLPIFTLEGVEGRLFRPLAFTKNFAMLFGAVLAITLVPALVMTFIRQKPGRFLLTTIHAEEAHPVSRFLFKLYNPVIRGVLKRPVAVIAFAVVVFAASMPLFGVLGREFMPPLNEGSALYMPTTFPGLSVGQASQLLTLQDRIIRSFPEVQSVFGKAGRAETSTDPAPFSMMETTVVFKPQPTWRTKDRWYSQVVPGWLKPPFQFFWPETLSYSELIAEINAALDIPGQVNSWTLPIKGRLDMLTTGVRTPVGIKVYGDDLKVVENLGKQIEQVTRTVKGTRSVYAERTTGGYFVDYTLKREQMARYGLSVQEVQTVLSASIGGEDVGQTIEGRERFPIQVRYPREFRDDLDKLSRVYIPTPSGVQIPINQIADVSLQTGPGMIRDENGRLAGYVFIDVTDRDIGSYVEDLKVAIQKNVTFPQGYSVAYSGQYEFMMRVAQKMVLVIPLTLLIIFFLIYLNTRSYTKTFIVLLAVPFSLIGVVWALWLLGFNISIGVWAGIIALLGVDAETGIFMLMYLDLSYEEAKLQGRMSSREHLSAAVIEGAVQRIRPKLMTVLAAFMGLLPIMWSPDYEAGADMMKRIAAPMVGGILSSFLMELLVYPAVYWLWRWHSEVRRSANTAA
jgi:Cu(I)/Ag(I) efflux system membrane protein CusA/SilA